MSKYLSDCKEKVIYKRDKWPYNEAIETQHPTRQIPGRQEDEIMKTINARIAEFLFNHYDVAIILIVSALICAQEGVGMFIAKVIGLVFMAVSTVKLLNLAQDCQ